MKKSNKVTAVILVLTILMTYLVVPSLAVSGNIPDDVVAMSSQVAIEIEQEGIVLLKNEDELNARVYQFPTSALKVHNKKINYYDFISSKQNRE